MASDVAKPLVSVIVPMYNVGMFALPCVNSLLGQTYSNIEYIIVDDGCTDNTIDLIEDAVGSDTRFKILHKENGGLSSARNFGTQRCHGDYAKTPVLDNYKMGQNVEFHVESGIEHLRKLLLLSGESGSACGKLFERSLINDLVFPEGQLFEDMGVIAKICSKIQKVAFSDACFYAYVTRPGSITTLRKQGSKHAKDMDRTIETVRRFAGSEFQGEFECFQSFCTLRVAMRVDPDGFDSKADAQKYLRNARGLAWRASRNPYACSKWRLRCALFSISPRVHNAFYALYAAISGKAIG